MNPQSRPFSSTTVVMQKSHARSHAPSAWALVMQRSRARSLLLRSAREVAREDENHAAEERLRREWLQEKARRFCRVKP
eukprot:2977644-Prymnesium_polylepis.1